MSVVEFIFRKAGEIFHFVKDILSLVVPSGIWKSPEKIEILRKYVGELSFNQKRASNQKATEYYKQGLSYGLKSGRSSPQVKYFIQFKDDLVRMVKELKFHKVKNDFQKMLHEHSTDIKKDTNSCRPDIQYMQIK